MIRTETEYNAAADRLLRDREILAKQREALQAQGFESTEVLRAMQPAVAFHEQLKEEVEAYERLVRGDVSSIQDLNSFGRLLIGLRIATGLTQRELAARLDVHESAVSRDERNEYTGITLERAQRVLEALGGSIRISAEPAAGVTPARRSIAQSTVGV